MARRRVPFAIHSYKIDELPAAKQRTLNMFAESQPATEKSPVTLSFAPGLNEFVDVGSGPVRGLYTTLKDQMLVVSGPELYRVDSAGNTKLAGQIAGSGPVEFAENTHRVAVVGGGCAFEYHKSNDIVIPITDEDFSHASSVAILDGIGIFIEPNDDLYFISGINNFNSINPLDFATAESSPDNTLAVLVHNREVRFLGSRQQEIWWDSGNVDFPLERKNDIVIEIGLAAANAYAILGNAVYWLGIEPLTGAVGVYRDEAYIPVRISTHAIEEAIAASDIANARAFAYSQKGHLFFVLTLSNMTLPGVSDTWVYDAVTGFWHERQTYRKDRWRADCHTYAFGKNYAGDFETGKVYEIDPGHHLDGGQPIITEAISSSLHANGLEFCVNTFELDIKRGFGVTTGQGSDPQAMLRYSDDGGNTWSREIWRGMGKKGEYFTQVTYDELGVSRERLWKLVISDPVPRATVAAFADIEVNDSP